MSQRVTVVGAGVAGLSTAFELIERATPSGERFELSCLEAEARPGGNVRTDRERGFLFEWAANGFLDNAPATLDLVRRIGLEDHIVAARAEAARRFVYARGKLRELPASPLAFLGSPILSARGRARVLAEPFIPARPADAADESVHDFASRRIGEEAARTLVDCLVSGVYGGDTARLSLRATFPKMHEMETRHGSLLRAMLARRGRARQPGTRSGGPLGPGGRLTSFALGLQELTDTLATRLGSRLRLATPLVQLSHLGRRGFRLHFTEGAPEEAEAVVLACPAHRAARIVSTMDPELAHMLAALESAPIAVVHFGYRREALPPRPDGFGFLAPRNAGLRILGTLWASDIFEGRAPTGSQLLTTMVGGAHDPHAADLDDATLVRIVREDLRTAMAALPDPYFVRVLRHPQGIPQYGIGHLERLAAIEQRLASFPGLFLTGASYRGVSINLCIEQARVVADRVTSLLGGGLGDAAATASKANDHSGGSSGRGHVDD